MAKLASIKILVKCHENMPAMALGWCYLHYTAPAEQLVFLHVFASMLISQANVVKLLSSVNNLTLNTCFALAAPSSCYYAHERYQ